MSQSLINRVKRIVSGAVRAKVDTLEARMPQAVMREAVREVEETIDELREEIAKFQSERTLAAKRLQRSKDKIAELTNRAEVALEADREDLAKACIERQLDLESQFSLLEKTQEDASDRIEELCGLLKALQGRKNEMDDELASFEQAQRETNADQRGEQSAANDRSAEKRADDAEKAFDRVLKNATNVAGMARSDADTNAKLVELEVLERKKSVADRLEGLRHKTTQVAS